MLIRFRRSNLLLYPEFTGFEPQKEMRAEDLFPVPHNVSVTVTWPL